MATADNTYLWVIFFLFIGACVYYAYEQWYKPRQKGATITTNAHQQATRIIDFTNNIELEVEEVTKWSGKPVIKFRNGIKIPYELEGLKPLNKLEIIAGKPAIFIYGDSENQYTNQLLKIHKASQEEIQILKAKKVSEEMRFKSDIKEMMKAKQKPSEDIK